MTIDEQCGEHSDPGIAARDVQMHGNVCVPEVEQDGLPNFSLL